MTTRTQSQSSSPLPLFSFPTHIPPRRDYLDVYSAGSIPEYDSDADADLDLGAESPASILNTDIPAGETDADEWAKSGIAVHTNVPMRKRNWRSSSFSSERKKKRELQREVVDRDCGICFELAVMPCKTLCCGKLFCLEHIADWLHGSSSDGRCPSCKTPCSLETNTLSLASPPPPLAIHTQTQNPASPTTPISKTDRPVILLLMQPSPTSSRSGSPTSSSSASSLASSSSSGSFSSSGTPNTDSHPPSLTSDPSSSTSEVLSRVLSIVGLTLVLSVLLK